MEKLRSKSKHAAQKIKQAQILLLLDKGKQHKAIAEAVGVSPATVYNVHGHYLQGKLAALDEKPRKVISEVEAAVTRIACSQVPEATPAGSFRS